MFVINLAYFNKYKSRRMLYFTISNPYKILINYVHFCWFMNNHFF